MKNKFLTSLFVLTFISVICSCSSKPENLIVGKWQMTEIVTNTPSDSPDVAEFLKDMAKNSSSVYNSDLTCEVTVNSITTKGRWTILADGKQLHFIDESGAKVIMTIESITSDQLVLSTKDGDVVTKQIFSKVN